MLQLHDLNGDIVGTASLSESETKLLSTHNSTEFGVPVGGKEPPKYSWLGADGVTSELPSGAITQDGITYVPLTGEPLQTQPVEIPLPIKYYEPYEKPNAEGATWGPASAALRVAEYWEAKRKAEEAAAGGSGGCDEETEGCGSDPEHGDDTAGCGVWVSWKHYINNDLGVNGHFVCNYDVTFEIQVALLLVESDGDYKMVDFAKHVEPFILSMQQYSYSPGAWQCTPYATYQAWAWGRYWNSKGQTVWDASALDGHYEQCPGELADVEPPGGE